LSIPNLLERAAELAKRSFRSPRGVKPAAELALVVAPPRPDLSGGRYGEGVVVTGGDGAHGRREGGHGRGHVGVGSRWRLAHRAMAIIPEPVHHAGARGPGTAAGERGEEAPRSEGVRAGKEERTHLRSESGKRRLSWAECIHVQKRPAQPVNRPYGASRWAYVSLLGLPPVMTSFLPKKKYRHGILYGFPHRFKLFSTI
jgi:hypothetical protein